MSSSTTPSSGSTPWDRLSLRPVAIAVTLIAFGLYLATLNPTFGFIDKGELVADASTLGIAHPTGYPTIMLLGYLFTKILPLRPVLALNVMAALFTAIGGGMMTLLLYDMIGRVNPTVASSVANAKKGRGKGGAKEVRVAAIPDGLRALYAGLGGLFTAVTSTWWDQGNGFEVYSLHAIMMPLVTLLFLRYVDQEAERNASGGNALSSGFTRRGMWFALALGLSFSNHMTTILLAPAFLGYYFWRLGSGAASFKRLLFLAPPFLLGLLPYIWLPIRASMKPEFNWGNPDTLKRFFDHVSGKQYQVWMFTNPDTFREQSAYFFGGLAPEVGYLGVALVLFGIFHLSLRNLRLSVFALLLFVVCVIYAGGYDIMEIGPYYLTAIFAVGIWATVGIVGLHERFGRTVGVAVAAMLVALTILCNYHGSDESPNTLVEDMTVNMLGSVPKNAIIFSSQWDFWVAGSFYMQGVEQMRRDVLVTDPELLRRSWYLDQMEVNHPEFMRPVKAQVDAFRAEAYKFEHNIPYDPMTIQSTYVSMINAMIDSNIDRRPVLMTGEISSDFGAGYRRVPNRLTLRLVREGKAYVPENFPSYRFRFWNGHVDGYTARISELYGRSLYARALYEAEFGHNALALRYLQYALTFDPGYSMADIPSLPLNSEDQVAATINFFGSIRSMRH